jgi:hypothetical protein
MTTPNIADLLHELQGGCIYMSDSNIDYIVNSYKTDELLTEAADTLERQAAEIERLRGALGQLHRDCLANDFNELWDSYTAAQAVLAASPVVPVGVSREDEAWSLAMGIPAFNDLPAQFQQDIHAAILAALRPTDTGRE